MINEKQILDESISSIKKTGWNFLRFKKKIEKKNIQLNDDEIDEYYKSFATAIASGLYKSPKKWIKDIKKSLE